MKEFESKKEEKSESKAFENKEKDKFGSKAFKKAVNAKVKKFSGGKGPRK